MGTDRAGSDVAEEHIDELFKALASAQRREILRILAEESGDEDRSCCAPHEVCACKLAERLGLVASTVSHHMTVLRKAGLVQARKDGQWVYYTLDRGRLDEAARRIQTL